MYYLTEKPFELHLYDPTKYSIYLFLWTQIFSSNGVFKYDANQKSVDITKATCTYAQQPEMYKTFQPCASVGADGRTSGLDQLFIAQISWNISGTVIVQVRQSRIVFSFFVMILVKKIDILAFRLKLIRPIREFLH